MSGPRIVLADDDALARSALAELLVAESDIGSVVECEGLDQLREALRTIIDLVLLAESLDPGTDFRVCSECAQAAPVLMLARGPAESVLLPALKAGAIGVVAMTASYAELATSVRAALRGEPSIPAGMLGALLRDLIEMRRREDQAVARYRRLTERERDVLALLARGLDVGGIATALVLSPQTVRSHLQHVLGKLEVHSRAEAVSFLLDHDLLDQSTRGNYDR